MVGNAKKLLYTYHNIIENTNNTTMVIIIIIIIIIIITIKFPETRKYWFDVQKGISLISWGEGSSLALVGNLSRDGVSIKILVWRHLKSNPQLL